MHKKRLIVILGPTAVGKTALSVRLAKALGTEIISGDSMLVYRGCDIGTAKPTPEEQAGVKHHLIDILPPEQGYSVTDFRAAAERLVADINARGMVPILAGGTGLYVKSLLEGYRFSEAPEDAAYRRELEELAARKGKAYVHGLLAAKDPAAAARLHVNDFRRVVRALEVARRGTETVSRRAAFQEAGELAYDALVVGLRRERAELYARINARVEMMFRQGLADEVKSLLAGGATRTMPAMKGIGYKEMAACLAGEMTPDEAKELIRKSTRHFAKRQLTWYRKMPYIRWLDAGSATEEELLGRILHEAAAQFGLKQPDGCGEEDRHGNENA